MKLKTSPQPSPFKGEGVEQRIEQISPLVSQEQTSPLAPLLRGEGNSKTDITKVLDLKNRSFLVNKSYKIDYKNLEKLYISLVNIDKKMKSGKLLGSEEDDLRLEIEKSLIFFQKFLSKKHCLTQCFFISKNFLNVLLKIYMGERR